MILSRFKLFGLVFLVTLAGCSNTSYVNNDLKTKNTAAAEQSHYPIMAVPLQATLNQEIGIARLNHLLASQDLSDEVRAEAYYRRAKHFEQIGLRDLARIDFGSSLKINPAQPDIFNHLGLYFTQVGEYDAAYEAFDSTLELDPENQDALYNRAVALYYGDRIELALEDITAHYKDNPADPFRSIWLYIIECESDENAAIERLSNNYQQRNDRWGWVLAAIILGEISEEQAVNIVMNSTQDNTLIAQRLTEVYFYLGKKKKADGHMADALSLYKLAISFNVYDYVEHGYSFRELDRIYLQHKAEKKAVKTAKLDNKSLESL